MTTAYDFEEQLEQGHYWEREVTNALSRWYDVRPSTEREDRKLGIDCFLRSKACGVEQSVQIKADIKACTYNNLFLEIRSDVDRQILGWAFTEQAEQHLHYVPPPVDTAYWWVPKTMREYVWRWISQYPCKDVQNKGWLTRGVCVPCGIVRAATGVTVQRDILGKGFQRKRTA